MLNHLSTLKAQANSLVQSSLSHKNLNSVRVSKLLQIESFG